MTKKNKMTFITEDKLKKWIKYSLTILLVIALGLFCVNQGLQYTYKTEFLKKPCKLCGELNPEVQKCITELNTRESYWTPDGWTDPFENETKYN